MRQHKAPKEVLCIDKFGHAVSRVRAGSDRNHFSPSIRITDYIYKDLDAAACIVGSVNIGFSILLFHSTASVL
jgi:hypothetical protein